MGEKLPHVCTNYPMSKNNLDSLASEIADRCICDLCVEAVQKGLSDRLHCHIESAIINKQTGKAGQEGQGASPAQEGQAGHAPTETPTDSPTAAEDDYPHKEYFEKLYNRLAPYERRMAEALRKVWEQQRRIIVANLRKLRKWYGIRGIVRKDDDDIVASILYPSRPFISELSEEAKRFFIYVMAKEGQQFLDELDIDYRFDVMDANVQKFIKGYAPKFSKALEEVNVEELRKQLKEAFDAGEGIPDIIKRVNGTYENWNKVRSERIARSESIRASNSGFQASMEQSGVVEKKVWLTSPGACEWCAALQNKVIELRETFFKKGDEFTIGQGENQRTMRITYGDVGYPPLHPQCYVQDTEVYTNEGWKFFKDLTGQEECLSFDPNDKTKRAFLPIINRIAYRHNGVILKFTRSLFEPGVTVDLAVTPDHKMLAIENGKIVFKEALTFHPKLYKAILYNDMVYCVELAKYHTLWVRRNGKTAWCGNCRCSIGAEVNY
jgi:hypothetical protein